MENYETKAVDSNERVMTVKDWLITLLLTCIPFVGIILIFVFAFSGDGNQNKKNWARAQLIIVAIIFTLTVLLWGILGAMIMALLGAGY